MDTAKARDWMEELILKFPENLRESMDIGSKAIAKFNTAEVKNVLIVGLGGSGIGGLIVSQLVWDECRVPIEILRDYRIPAWVDSNTLCIACSYSGNTEETLSALSEAMARNAQIACITSGGKLRGIAYEKGFNFIEIPGGQPPRTSFGYNASQQLYILNAYGLIDKRFEEGLKGAVALLTKESGAIRAEAAAIANKIAESIPVIYSETRTEGLAVRLRQQINENAKMLCWHHSLPEMNHNELVGWSGGDDRFSVLLLHSPEDQPGTVKRMKLTEEIISKYTSKFIHLNPKGKNRIERAYYLVHLGDWISFYLARERNVDPVEIEVINYLKAELEK